MCGGLSQSFDDEGWLIEFDATSKMNQRGYCSCEPFTFIPLTKKKPYK